MISETSGIKPRKSSLRWTFNKLKALRLSSPIPLDQLETSEVPEPRPGPGEALIRLKAAALNHRDLWQFIRGWQGSFILGSDGTGVVESLGPGATGLAPGAEVVINPSFDWGEREEAYSSQFTILGNPRDGTFAEFIVVPAENVFPKPPHLTWEEAGALPLAGLTAYRVLFSRATLQRGEHVLIHGIGGGVAILALQFAKLAGAMVMVTSTSDEKLERALALGADFGVNSRSGDWDKAAREWSGGEGVDVVVESVGGELFARSIHALRLGGRLVTFGATGGPPPSFDLRTVYWNQLSILGSTMGSPSDFGAMLKIVNERKLKPVIDSVWPLAQGREALMRMAQGRQFGKIVLTCG
ncbi:MAG: zinc-binding dehydrogenase [Chloroflexi bacterium]|nr:zinc-binding dehydrogenase [Chloroflexota bacterium]